MSRRQLAIVLGFLLLVLLAVVPASLAALDRTATYRVNGFRFEGPVELELEGGLLMVEGAVGRRDPQFLVRPLSEHAIRNLNEEACEPVRVGEYAGLLSVRETFAPGHGGRDHTFFVLVPELGAGVCVDYRAHYDGLFEQLDAWLCRRWTRTVIESLEWDAADH